MVFCPHCHLPLINPQKWSEEPGEYKQAHHCTGCGALIQIHVKTLIAPTRENFRKNTPNNPEKKKG